jgi:cytochrome oxidase Cu insertion factor (SCO1/SenC/PrrC family)
MRKFGYCWCKTAVQYSTVPNVARTGILLSLLFSALAGAQVLPRPQIATAEGKLAPDFTLKDQEGKSFHLASVRGKRVLLIFYRGYW